MHKAKDPRSLPKSHYAALNRTLVHFFKCRRDVRRVCHQLKCLWMKRNWRHRTRCEQQKSGGSCRTCIEMKVLLMYHFEHCSEAGCKVPTCCNGEFELEERRQQQAQAGVQAQLDNMSME